MGASAELKDMLFEAYPEAITAMALHEVLRWGPKAVRCAMEAMPEVPVHVVASVCSHGAAITKFYSCLSLHASYMPQHTQLC